jgi:hypothetical protein
LEPLALLPPQDPSAKLNPKRFINHHHTTKGQSKLGKMRYSSQEDEKIARSSFSHQFTQAMSSDDKHNSPWNKQLNSSQRKTMITISSPKRSQSRLRTFLLISLLVSQSIGVIGFFTSVFISLKPYVSSDSDRGYQAMLGYLVGDFCIPSIPSLWRPFADQSGRLHLSTHAHLLIAVNFQIIFTIATVFEVYIVRNFVHPFF